MTLKQLLKEIGELAINQKCCNYSAAGTSLDELNPIQVDYYPVLFTSPTGNHRVRENTTQYNITLYWVERLLEDNSNDVDIFSTAIEQLKNIIIGIRKIAGVVDVNFNYDIRNFATTEKMNDRLAGAYCTVQIEVVNETLCFVE